MIWFDMGANLYMVWIGLVFKDEKNRMGWGVLTAIEEMIWFLDH
jgi:hypothetical protein